MAVTAATAVLASLALAGCGGGDADGSTSNGSGGTPVSIGVLSSGMTTLPPERLSDDKSLQKKYGLDVSVRYYTNLQELFPGMAAGDVDATIATSSGLAAQAIQGAPLAVVGTAVSDESVVLLGTGKEITTADQLKGKRITALAAAGTWRTMQAQIDQKFGLTGGEDYEVVSVNDLVAGAAQVVAGTADYALAWEPYATQAMSKSDDLHVVLTATDLKDYTSWQLVIGTQAGMSDDVKSRLIDALGEAADWVESNPAEADKAYAESLGYEPGVVESVLNGDLYAFDIHPLTSDDEQSIMTDLKLTQSQGGLEKLPDASFLAPPKS